MENNKKICSMCKEEKDTNLFVKDKHSVDGFYSRCKECSKEGRYNRIAIIKSNKKTPKVKVCSTCKLEKSEINFTKDANNLSGLHYECKECAKKRYNRYLQKKILAVVVPDTKLCKKCKIEKHSSNFTKRSGSLDGLHEYCKNCRNNTIHENNLVRQVLIPETKVCFTCRVNKTAQEFTKKKYVSDGLWFECKECADNRRHLKNNRIKKEHYIAPTRKCPKCLVEKNASEFHKDSSNPLGLVCYCKECQSKIAANYYKKIKQDCVALNNKRTQSNKAHKRRYLSNDNYRIRIRMRTRIAKVLKGKRKCAATLRLLGCDLSYFKKYFISLFTRGMTWELFIKGNIHIDHIIPCSFFNLSDPIEQVKCFNYKNLQPLWGSDNNKKHSKISWDYKNLSLKKELDTIGVLYKVNINNAQPTQ